MDLHYENEVEKVDVPQNIELPDLLERLKEKTGYSAVAKLEEFDQHFQEWLLVTEMEELNLYNGAKLKVTKK